VKQKFSTDPKIPVRNDLPIDAIIQEVEYSVDAPGGEMAFTKDLEPTRTLDEWALEIDVWAGSKGWNDREITEGEWIALAHSELSEALEAHRDSTGIGMVIQNGKPEGVAVEYADCLIRILHWFARHNISPDEVVGVKMDYNKTRSYKHGGKEL